MTDSNKILLHHHRNYFWGWSIYPIEIERDEFVHAYEQKDGGKWVTIPLSWFGNPKQISYVGPMSEEEIEQLTANYQEYKESLAQHNGA